jgi:DNA polymerase V
VLYLCGYNRNPSKKLLVRAVLALPVTDFVALQEAITTFACGAAEKLRQQGSHAGVLIAFIRTSRFESETLSTVVIACSKYWSAPHLHKAHWRCSKRFKGQASITPRPLVMLMDFSPASRHQYSLDLGQEHDASRGRLISAMDGLNQRFGLGTVTLETAGVACGKQWSMKQERRTPLYTTRWDELLTVKC